MKKSNVINLFKVLVSNNKTDNIKFNYWINKNIKELESEIDSLKKIEEDNEAILKEYSEERLTLFKKHGTLNDDKIEVKSDNIEFQKALSELEIKYKDELNKYIDAENQRLEILSEDVDLKLFKISYELLPSKLNDIDNLNSLYILMENIID